MRNYREQHRQGRATVSFQYSIASRDVKEEKNEWMVNYAFA